MVYFSPNHWQTFSMFPWQFRNTLWLHACTPLPWVGRNYRNNYYQVQFLSMEESTGDGIVSCNIGFMYKCSNRAYQWRKADTLTSTRSLESSLCRPQGCIPILGSSAWNSWLSCSLPQPSSLASPKTVLTFTHTDVFATFPSAKKYVGITYLQTLKSESFYNCPGDISKVLKLKLSRNHFDHSQLLSWQWGCPTSQFTSNIMGTQCPSWLWSYLW